jgi:hypothetical protein
MRLVKLKNLVPLLIILSLVFTLNLTFCSPSPIPNNTEGINPDRNINDDSSSDDGDTRVSSALQNNINMLRNMGLTGQVLQDMVMQRAAGIAPYNRPYIGNGYQDCYGYCRQTWNAILYDGKVHSEDFNSNYDNRRWHGISGGIPVNTKVDYDWVPINNPDELLPGDLLANERGHRWGLDGWHGGMYAGKVNGTHYQWDCAWPDGAYKRVYNSNITWYYYYKPLHDLLAENSTGATMPQAETAIHSNGQVEIYMRGADGRLWHCWQNWNNGWLNSFSNWYPFDNTQVKGNPTAVYQQDGKIVLYAVRNDGASLRRTEIPGQGWTNWYSLGGISTHDLAIAPNNDGRIQVIQRGTTSHIYNRYQKYNNSGTYNYNWIDEGGWTDHGPTITKNQDGKLVVFTRWKSGISAYMYQTTVNGVESWSNWYSSGGYIQEAPTVINHDGYIWQFVRGSDNSVYVNQQKYRNSTGAWWGWSKPGGATFIATSKIAASSNTNGSLMIFARGQDNAVWSNRLSNGSWSGWSTHGGIITSAPEVGSFQDGRLFFVVRGDNGKLFIKRQTSPSSVYWTGWVVVGDDVGRF